MRKLSKIRDDLEKFNDDKEFVRLMNELERDYKTFGINSSEMELNRPAVQLYRDISAKRKLHKDG